MSKSNNRDVPTSVLRLQEAARQRQKEAEQARKAAESKSLRIPEQPLAAPPWQPRQKPPPDPKGKYKCSHCGDKCSVVSKHFIGRVNSKGLPLYQVFCYFCAMALYGTRKDILHDSKTLKEKGYVVHGPSHMTEEFAHRNLVTFRKEK